MKEIDYIHFSTYFALRDTMQNHTKDKVSQNKKKALFCNNKKLVLIFFSCFQTIKGLFTVLSSNIIHCYTIDICTIEKNKK